MAELGESVSVWEELAELVQDDHWIQVEYTYCNGLPVEGRFLAADGSGMVWTGTLNDEGKVCLSDLPSGNVTVHLFPFHDEDQLNQIRQQIKLVLDEIIRAEQQEAIEVAQEYAKYGPNSYQAALVFGLWDGAVGLVVFAKDVVVTAAEVANYINPANKLANLLNAGYKSYQDGASTEAEWRESLFENYKDEEFKDLAELLGFDIRELDAEKIEEFKLAITEAYEITAFILDDDETKDILTQFLKDYANAQSSYEWTEIVGGGAFELVLTALLLVFTGGIGNVAQAASKIRHVAKLERLGSLFRRLGGLLKRRNLDRRLTVGIDSDKSATVELPDEIGLRPSNAVKNASYRIGESDGGPGSWSRETTPNQGADYQRQVTGAPTNTEYVVETPHMNSGLKKFDGYDPDRNVLLDSKDWSTGPDGWPAIGKNGEYQPWSYDSVVNDATTQARIGQDLGTTVEWHVPTIEKADELMEILQDNRISGIDIVVTPKL